jgi:hypothetical protein
MMNKFYPTALRSFSGNKQKPYLKRNNRQSANVAHCRLPLKRHDCLKEGRVAAFLKGATRFINTHFRLRLQLGQR